MASATERGSWAIWIEQEPATLSANPAERLRWRERNPTQERLDLVCASVVLRDGDDLDDLGRQRAGWPRGTSRSAGLGPTPLERRQWDHRYWRRSSPLAQPQQS